MGSLSISVMQPLSKVWLQSLDLDFSELFSESEGGGLSILVVGSVALDTVETPFAKVEEVLGGAASFFSTAASLYNQVNLVAVVGSDFPQEHLDFWRSRPVNLEGLQIMDGKTFRWSA